MLVSEHLSQRWTRRTNRSTYATWTRSATAADPDPARRGPGPSHVVGRHLTADLVEVLTIKYGATARPVRPEEVGCWPITAAQALDLALENVRQDERLRSPRPRPRRRGDPAAERPPPSAPRPTCAGWRLPAVPADGVLVALPDPAH